MAGETQRRPLLVSRVWVQAAILVVLCGFFILGLLAYRTYTAQPPVPETVVDRAGRSSSPARTSRGPAGLPAQRADGVRLGVRPRRLPRAGLHRRLPAPRRRTSSSARYGGRASDAAARRTVADFRTQPLRRAHRHADASAPRRRGAFRGSCPTTAASSPSRRPGTACARTRSPIRRELRQLTAFFAWTAWAASTNRPGHDYSYTNNWPPEPRVDNTADGERDRLVGAVADRAARRHRHAVRRLRALGAQARLARPRAGDAVVPRARRRRPDAGAARHARGSSS